MWSVSPLPYLHLNTAELGTIPRECQVTDHMTRLWREEEGETVPDGRARASHWREEVRREENCLVSLATRAGA